MPDPTPTQIELNNARTQVTSKSNLVILREQTANILAIVNTLAGELRLLRLAFEGSQDGAAHHADQRLIQDQATQIVDLTRQLAEQSEGGSFY